MADPVSLSPGLRAAFPFFAGAALCVGVVGAGGIVWACVNLLGATRLALLNMTEEAEAIRARDRARPAPGATNDTKI